MMVITSHFNVTVSALFASVLMIMMAMDWQDQRVFAKQQSVLSLVCQHLIVSFCYHISLLFTSPLLRSLHFIFNSVLTMHRFKCQYCALISRPKTFPTFSTRQQSVSSPSWPCTLCTGSQTSFGSAYRGSSWSICSTVQS